jgi:hypothetical protein
MKILSDKNSNSRMVKGRRFILKRHFDGLPKREDFDLVEEELPELKDGEFQFR